MNTGEHSTHYDPFAQDWMAATASGDPFAPDSFPDALSDIFGTRGNGDNMQGITRMQQDGQDRALDEMLRSERGGASGGGSMGGGGGQFSNKDDGRSPYSHSTYSYAGSSGGDTSLTSYGGGANDFDSFLSASFPPPVPHQQPSPPFSYGTVEELANNLPPTFDTSSLQSLFAGPSPSSSSISGNSLSPYSAQPYGTTLQTFSPAPTIGSSASPLSPYLQSFHQGMSPNQLFSSSASSSTSSPPNSIPRLSVDHGEGPGGAQTFGAFQAQQAALNARTSLAATAGVSVPPLLYQPSSHPINIANSTSQFSFTVKNDPSAPPVPLAMLQHQAQVYAAQQQATAHLPNPPSKQLGGGMTTRREKRQQSPVEVIANAGLQGQAVYQTRSFSCPSLLLFPIQTNVSPCAALLQLRPNAQITLEQAAANASAAKVKREEEAATGKGKGAAAPKGKAAGGKKADKGHSASSGLLSPLPFDPLTRPPSQTLSSKSIATVSTTLSPLSATPSLRSVI
jgi:hypothetical protein